MATELRGAGIIGIGSFAPQKVLTNLDLERIVDTTDEWIFTRSGIRERHVAEEKTGASDLALEASKRALESASIRPEDIDLVICATITGDMPFPATSCLVQDRIGATKAAAFDLQAGCSGWVYALATASQFVRLGTYDYVLAVGVDVLTSVTDWTDRSTCVLFGDAAGATVIGPTAPGTGVLSACLGANGSRGDLLRIDAGGSKLPASEETVRNRQHYIKMEGREVYKFAVRIMGEASIKALEMCGLKPTDVDLFVPHQANIRIIEAAAERLNFPQEKVFVNVQSYGNTSAASIPLALDEAYRLGRIKQGDIVAVVGFGAGLTWAASVLKWTLPGG
ncbi:MAG TPA: beta-ketoacyl-ACP synthase III [Armatimonadota bacterium]|nr:beta-ketoacyl-ACP synthase III [Armatimonadota bacterium]